MRLKGKRAIITGAASGIGRAGVELFTREGATVVALDIDEASLAAMVADVHAVGGNVIGIKADLSDRDDCKRAFAEAVDRLGGVDVLWLHAGVVVFGDFDGLDLDAYDRGSNLNLVGPMIGIGIVSNAIRRNGGGGSIILTASISGLVGSTISPVYSMHKFATVGMAKSLALTLGKDGIRVNAVCPGFTRTPALVGWLAKGGDQSVAEAALAQMGSELPLSRVGRPEDIAHAALWLASDDSSYVTGVALPVDGGYTAK